MSVKSLNVLDRKLRGTGRRRISTSLLQKNLAAEAPNDWYCRAGARYLHVCEDGLAHWCSQQRGHPGIPLDHNEDNLQTEYHREKICAPLPVGILRWTFVTNPHRNLFRNAVAAVFGGRR